MNVLTIKKIIFFFSFLILISSSFAASYNICGVSIDEPYFEVKDSTKGSVLIVDRQGDIFFRGEDHTLNNKGSEKSFEINGMFFNSITSKFNTAIFLDNQGSLPSTQSLIIEDSSGNSVTKFTKSGGIYTKGKGAFQGSQAACPPDRNYCDGTTVMHKDNYCDITGNKIGGCAEKNTFVQSCVASATTRSGWNACSNSSNKKRTVTTYTPTCSGAGFCGETSAITYETSNCGSTKWCSGGNCIARTYSWSYGAYGTCSVTCGGGTQTRSATCYDNLGNVATGNCGSSVTSRSCNSQICPYWTVWKDFGDTNGNICCNTGDKKTNYETSSKSARVYCGP